ncbi:MAG: hypothetical protein A4E62_02983 [Syntrophorhabdus sp. PtaU1.Bin002]|nr:MAG: hypothetical protein A4E62_02983 [Syntrophorhabdus sp. PtaU1.Bin002]
MHARYPLGIDRYLYFVVIHIRNNLVVSRGSKCTNLIECEQKNCQYQQQHLVFHLLSIPSIVWFAS